MSRNYLTLDYETFNNFSPLDSICDECNTNRCYHLSSIDYNVCATLSPVEKENTSISLNPKSKLVTTQPELVITQSELVTTQAELVTTQSKEENSNICHTDSIPVPPKVTKSLKRPITSVHNDNQSSSLNTCKFEYKSR